MVLDSSKEDFDTPYVVGRLQTFAKFPGTTFQFSDLLQQMLLLLYISRRPTQEQRDKLITSRRTTRIPLVYMLLIRFVFPHPLFLHHDVLRVKRL